MLADFDRPFHSMRDLAAFHMHCTPDHKKEHFKVGASCIQIRFDEFLVTGGVANDDHMNVTKNITRFSPGKTTFTSSLVIERAYHVSLMLKNSEIFVCGGINLNFDQAERSGEIYIPKKNRWIKTGSMNSKRDFGHAACLLQNGRVLIAGGAHFVKETSTLHSLATAEIFNPITLQFAKVPPLPTPSHHLSLTLLQNDYEVLATGGGNGTTLATPQASIFNTRSKMWKKVAPMNMARSGHLTALLKNGTVIVGGGCGPHNENLKSVELYSPSLNKWTLFHDGMTTDLFNQIDAIVTS